MTDLFAYLRERPYPGRGILLGNLPDGRALCAYFIMGRSENSRNRVFEQNGDGIRTKAFDECGPPGYPAWAIPAAATSFPF